MAAPEIIHKLVENFNENRDGYRSGKYNEAQLRLEFLNPFFESLGWDVYNKNGWAPENRDVVIEDSMDIEGSSKKPDYTFKLGRERKFFVEAKKPKVDIQYDIHPAYQLRRYAWNAHMPLSVLTDFEELAIYNCKAKPDVKDSAATAREKFYRYTDYVEKWDEIAGILSKDAVWKGAFDRFADASKGKKGTTAVDDEFLKDMSNWRVLLARNIALRNPIGDEEQLNYAVQMTIDRIIFLRICEDRGIEPEEQLKGLAEKPGIYTNLVDLFKRADIKYNSGLFHFKLEKGNGTPEDRFTPGLNIDDKVLKEIIKDIYYPCPYIFKEIPVEILGQVYEQFLGKVIRLTAGHRAEVEEKPEVRKAGGVYYTPKYIVDYIVQNTVGKLLEGKTPAEAARLKIVDPACGSGSFLLGAYQHLLDWHLKWYSENDAERWVKGKNAALTQTTGALTGGFAGYRLTTEKKKEILVNNIHGVDIDAQAVEVTKLSLLLKVLEEESGQLTLGFERALPDLGKNIQCGNSLIGEDYFAGRLVSDPAERKRVNPFDWQRAFPEVFAQGGFDAVIGNPPYSLVDDKKQKSYYSKSYLTTEGRIDTFELFIEKGITLCNQSGELGYIIPSPLLSNLYSRKLRKYLLTNCGIREITNFGLEVFRDPTIHTCIIIINSKKVDDHVKIRKKVTDPSKLSDDYDYEIEQSKLGINANSVIDIFVDPIANQILQRMNNNAVELGEICFIRQCIKTGDDATYVKKYSSPPGEPWKPTLRGRSISRYSTLERNEYVKYGKWLARNWKNDSFYKTEKIGVRETGNQIIATLDTEYRYFLSSLYAIYPKLSDTNYDIRYLLGFLNSSLATYFIKTIALELTTGAFSKFRTNQLARLPVKKIDLEVENANNICAFLINLVDRMLDLHKQTPTTPREQEQLQREIESTDRQIDALVYELYGLTEEEIRIVKGDER